MARPDVSTERKNQILDTATAVFARRGFHQARMDDIVQESGLSKGAIYWYFKSKDDIILALAQRFFDPEVADIQARLSQEGSVCDRLRAYIQRVVCDVQHMDESGVIPLIYEFYALATRHEPARQCIHGYFRAITYALVVLVQQGMDGGEFRPAPPFVIAAAIGSLIEGTILVWVLSPSMVNLEEQATTTIDLFLEGLRK